MLTCSQDIITCSQYVLTGPQYMINATINATVKCPHDHAKSLSGHTRGSIHMLTSSQDMVTDSQDMLTYTQYIVNAPKRNIIIVSQDTLRRPIDII
jgi:hypothetical protein